MMIPHGGTRLMRSP